MIPHEKNTDEPQQQVFLLIMSNPGSAVHIKTFKYVKKPKAGRLVFFVVLRFFSRLYEVQLCLFIHITDS